MEVVTSARADRAGVGRPVFAWRVCRHVRSNAIVLARGGATIGIGAGQMSRVDSVRLAIEKAQADDLARRRARLRRVLPVRRRPRARRSSAGSPPSSSPAARCATPRSSPPPRRPASRWSSPAAATSATDGRRRAPRLGRPVRGSGSATRASIRAGDHVVVAGHHRAHARRRRRRPRRPVRADAPGARERRGGAGSASARRSPTSSARACSSSTRRTSTASAARTARPSATSARSTRPSSWPSSLDPRMLVEIEVDAYLTRAAAT